MLTQDQIQAIQAPFPSESLSSDTSRGFELTSIKAAFVIERSRRWLRNPPAWVGRQGQQLA